MSVRAANTVMNASRRLKRVTLGLIRTLSAVPTSVLVAALMFCGSLSAQTTDRQIKSVHCEPRIRITIPSLIEVESKLKWLIELSPDPQLRKQWKKLKQDLIDAFTDGIDEGQPIVVDVVFSPNGLAYDLRIPISNLTDERAGFLSGLRGRSYSVRKLGEDTYEILGDDQQPARMSVQQNYAWIATNNRSVPTPPLSATSDVEPVLKLKKDIVAELKNHTDDLQSRTADFHAFREYVEGGRRKKRNESQNAFELRKLTLKHLLNAVEPVIVEAEHLQVSWNINTSTASGVGRGDVSLTGIPGTSLSGLIEETGTRPSYFANIIAHDNVLAAARVSASLDAIRSRQLKELSKSLRPLLENEIEARASKTERDALARAVNVMFKMTEEVAELGAADGFVELFAPVANKNVLLCGMRAANGKEADEIVKLVPNFRTDWKVKFNASEHAGVSIHELTVGKQDQAAFQCVFTNESVVYVGTGKGAVWIAAGQGALDHLKGAIDQVGRPSDKISPVVFRYQLQVGRLASLFDSLQKVDSPRKKLLTQDERLFRKDIDNYTKLIHDATAKCDSSFSGELRRTGNRIEGFTELNECVLRCVGSILASTLKDLE